MDNAAIFDPESHELVVYTSVSDVKVIPNSDGVVAICFSNLIEGIEIVHSSDRLWWPVV